MKTGLSGALIGSAGSFNTEAHDEDVPMIRVQIGVAEYELSDVSESWINEQIGRRRNDSVLRRSGMATCYESSLKDSLIQWNNILMAVERSCIS